MSARLFLQTHKDPQMRSYHVAALLRVFCFAMLCAGLVMLSSSASTAQSVDNGGWQTDLDVGVPFPTGPNTTVIPRSNPDTPSQDPQTNTVAVELMAFLTAEGQQIDRGLVWRIFKVSDQSGSRNELLTTQRAASPTVRLKPGDYLINASFGRAHLTRKFTVREDSGVLTERFVLNAGGLRLKAMIDGSKPQRNTVTYSIYEGELNQSGDRDLVLANVRPELIIRLNAGIYHIISKYGDANAKVAADVTVEAGKLTEAMISHTAARVTFKLVTREGGEALPGTQWTLKTENGEIVKRSVGALPTHIIAPGTYSITAKAGGQDYQRQFEVGSGDIAEVEVLRQ